MVRDTESRLGTFELPEAVLRRTPEKLRIVFNKVIVISAVKVFGRDVHQYVGYSEEFDWIPNGAKVPFYEVGRHKNGLVYFKRLEEK